MTNDAGMWAVVWKKSKEDYKELTGSKKHTRSCVVD